MAKTRVKINKPSQAFLDFLDMVNFLGTMQLPSYKEVVQLFEKTFPPHIAGDKALEAIPLMVKSIPKFYDYLSKGAENPDDFHVAGKYHEFQRDRLQLIRIIRRLQLRPPEPGDDRYSIGLDDEMVSMYLDSTGNLRSEVVAFSIFNDVDCTRLRFCSVCEASIFWAARTDMKFCSKKCYNDFYRWSNAEDEAKRRLRNEQRKEIYRLKKQGIVK